MVLVTASLSVHIYPGNQIFIMTQEKETQKQVEFFAASVNAWYNTSLEHDKSVLVLSSGGIGLLLTLLKVSNISHNITLLFLYIGAITGFIVALISVLAIFKRNRTHINRMFSDDPVTDDKMLRILDKAALFAFGIGALSTAIIGIYSAVGLYSTKGRDMTKETSSTTMANESFNGACNLQKHVELKKSFNGANSLNPQPVVTTTTDPANAQSSTNAVSAQNTEPTQAKDGSLVQTTKDVMPHQAKHAKATL